MVQWLGFHVFTPKDPGSIPDQGTKIPQVPQGAPPPRQEKKRKKISTTGVAPEGIMLSEMSQMEKYCRPSLLCGISEAGSRENQAEKGGSQGRGLGTTTTTTTRNTPRI